MATIQSLAQDYANYLALNQNNANVKQEIINRLNSLTYTSSGLGISDSDKSSILDEMERILDKNKHHIEGNIYLIKESEDSSELIKMIRAIRKIITG